LTYLYYEYKLSVGCRSVALSEAESQHEALSRKSNKQNEITKSGFRFGTEESRFVEQKLRARLIYGDSLRPDRTTPTTFFQQHRTILQFNLSLTVSCQTQIYSFAIMLLSWVISAITKALLLAALAPFQLLDFFVPGQHPVIPLTQCGLRLLLFNFKPQQFDRYDEYFRDDSFVRLAQTGRFEKADGIAEYVRFASESSPFFSTALKNFTNQNRFDGYDRETGLCSFLQISRWESQMNPDVSLNGKKFAITYMAKIYYDYRNNYVPQMDIFFPERYMKRLFGELLSSPQSRAFVCDVMTGPCSSILPPPDDCEAELALLEASEDASPFRTDGNYQGCRSLHAVFAEINPPAHCPHISFAPLADPNNKIKCQTTLGYAPEDFFTTGELEEYRDFVVAQEIDPNLGYLEYD